MTSEMVVKAARLGLSIGEVPITYRARGGESKLARYSDAWRHVRFLLLESPTFLFLVPGSIMLGASHSHSSGPMSGVMPGEFDETDDFVKKLATDNTTVADPKYV